MIEDRGCARCGRTEEQRVSAWERPDADSKKEPYCSRADTALTVHRFERSGAWLVCGPCARALVAVRA